MGRRRVGNPTPSGGPFFFLAWLAERAGSALAPAFGRALGEIAADVTGPACPFPDDAICRAGKPFEVGHNCIGP